jgi:hypothetical protein
VPAPGVMLGIGAADAACLHLGLVSWLADRHRVGEIACPECREVTPMAHWLSVLSESRQMVRDGSTPEVFDLVPGDGVMLDDSVMVAED